MNKLFEINGVDFYQEEFQDNIFELQDIIPLIQDFQSEMELEKIECVDLNECCEKTKENYISELVGVIDEKDDFYTLEEIIEILPKEVLTNYNKMYFKEKLEKKEDKQLILIELIHVVKKKLDGYVIQVYKCRNCNKWFINILE